MSSSSYKFCMKYHGIEQNLDLNRNLEFSLITPSCQRVPALKMSLYSTISRALALLYLYIRLFILRAILFITQTIEYRTLSTRLTEASRFVLLIGDGTAEGFGDSLGRTGLTSALKLRLRERRNEHNLKFPWRVVTAGRLYSTSEDWLPGTKLFRQTFEKGLFRDATIVVVTLGMHDDLSAGASAPAITNIIRIVDSLLDMDKAVIVPLLPTFHFRHSPLFTSAIEAGRALRDALQNLSNHRKDVKLSFEADMAKVCALGTDAFTMEEGFTTLNARGYRLFSADLIDDVILVAKKVEWSHWRHQLVGN